MRIKLDWRKSAQENAASYYQLAKELARKEEGAAQAIAKTKKQIGESEAALEKAAAKTDAPVMKRKKEWYEKYRWFFTSGGELVVAGRDARQNDLLVAKIMGENDLFFHADIQGAPATILKEGKKASAQEKLEAAQAAASHSSAWKVGAAAVDVYAVERKQLSKHAQGGFVGAGGFAIIGQREWFRSTPLGLAVGEKGGIVICLPSAHPEAAKMQFAVAIGMMEKGEAARRIAVSLGVRTDEVLLALPSGKFSLRERGKS